MTNEKFRNIKAILFDLDGTLMDTDDQSVERVAIIIKRLGICEPSKIARKIVMMAETPVNGIITFLDILGLDKLILPLWNNKERKGAFRIMQGVVPMLHSLKGRYHIAIVTTRGEEDSRKFINDNGLQGLFDLVVNRTSTKRLKPNPQPILFAAKQLGLPASACLMVGDTTPDIYSAKRAGALSVGVLCGYGTKDELVRAGAAEILDSTSQLAKLFT
jgi:phosphoglycolate phosphatase